MRQTFKYDRKRVLSRGANFAPASLEDLRYIWAAYKKDGIKLDYFGEFIKPGMKPDEFSEMFELFILNAGLDCYILNAPSKEGLIPIGFVLVWKKGRIIEVSRFFWFPWATKRNILESSLNFVNQFRSTVHEQTGKKYKLIGFIDSEQRTLFDHLIKYKTLRLVGKVYDWFEDGPAIVYETRL